MQRERAYGCGKMKDDASAEELKREVGRLSQELKNISQLLSSVFEGLDEAVVIINGDYRIVHASKKAAQLAAKSTEELIGGYCYGEFHKLAMPCSFCSTVKTIATKQPQYAFYKWQLPIDGSEHYIEHFSFPIKDPDGEIGYVMEHLKDVTERVRMSDRLISCDSLIKMGERVAELIHEIKNPLNAIDIQMSLLEREVRSLGKERMEGIKEIVGVVRGEIQRLSRLAADFLHHPDTPSSLNKTPERLEFLLRELATLARPQAAAQDIDINIEMKDVSLEVWVDKDKFKQALLNLVLNSMEAMPHGGVINLRAMGSDDEVKIFISDTGRGVMEGQWKHVFEMFYTTKSSGSGMGLPISRNIIEAHGGTLELISSPGGTTFLITLPSGSSS